MTNQTHGPAGITYFEEVKRKLIHLSSLWMVAAIILLPRWPLAAAFAVLLLLNLLVERARAERLPVLTPLYDLFFGRMLRTEPKPGQWIISGGPYVFAAALLATALFPLPASAVAMAVMLLGDTAAALVGRRFGRHKTVNGKSIEGIAAFIAVGLAGAAIVLAICRAEPVYYLMAGLGIVPAAAAELFEKQLRLDDNFSIPLVMGFFVALPNLWSLLA